MTTVLDGPDGVRNEIEHRNAENVLTCFAGGYSGDQAGTVVQQGFRLQRPGLSRDALHQNSRIFINKNGHVFSSRLPRGRPAPDRRKRAGLPPA